MCGADRIEIRVDPANAPSLAVPRKLGFSEEATLRRRLETGDSEQARRDVIVFSMFSDALAGTPIAKISFEAYDAVGERLA